MTAPVPFQPTALSSADQEALTDLYKRGTPPNTVRAWESDLQYISAWKGITYGEGLSWPESEQVAIRFILDHSTDLTGKEETPAGQTAQQMIKTGFRRSLDCPAPSTLGRRIASWRSFHRMKNLQSPFDRPLVKDALAKARRATARPEKRKSPNPITRAHLLQLIATCDDTNRGCRDRALLLFAFASGGRRRSEVSKIMVEDIRIKDYREKGVVWAYLIETKTTKRGEAPKLPLKGPAARAMITWLERVGEKVGPLFRPISKSDEILPRMMNPTAVREILRHRLTLAGLPVDFASPHGLRSGFLTQAALDGAPIQAAMRLSLHRSVNQASHYYDDVEIEHNPATNIISDDTIDSPDEK